MNENKKNTMPVILGCVILFALILTAVIAVMLGGQGEDTPVTPTVGVVPTDAVDAPTEAATTVQTDGDTQPAATTPQQTQPVTGPAPETTPATKPTAPPVQEPVTIPQMKEASYERWLCAGMVVGLSMEYPDFTPQAIYVTGETALEDRMSSGGAVILFTSGGRELALRSVPLEEGRKTPGTMDLSTHTLGFATFDVVTADSVNTAGMEKVALEDLTELIEQSLLVSLYWN